MSGKHTIAVWALVMVIFLMTVLVASAFLIETPAEVNRDPDAVASVNEGSETVSAVGNISPEFTRDSLATLAGSADDLGPISSLLIYQSGELIEEEYFGRMSDRSTHNIKSASKSVLSILVGIAIDEGYLDGVDQTIDEYFPDYFESNPDSLKEAITIGDLLTMRSGLASTSRRSYGRWVISENWIEYKLNQPMTGRSGIDRNYSTGNTHLLSVILTRAAGMSTRAFANKYLFEPMDIRVGGWDRDPQGYYMGGNNMALKPRDMIKIGEMMMNMGEYNGKEIVSQEWVVESVKPVTGRRPGVINYGYLWFRRESAGYEMVYAYGNGGQYILIIPEIKAIIAVTTRIGASNTRSYRRELFNLFDDTIVPGLSTFYVAG